MYTRVQFKRHISGMKGIRFQQKFFEYSCATFTRKYFSYKRHVQVNKIPRI